MKLPQKHIIGFLISPQHLYLDRIQYVLQFIENHPLTNNSLTFKINQKCSTNISYGAPTHQKTDIHFIIQEAKNIFQAKWNPKLYINRYQKDEQQLFSIDKKANQQVKEFAINQHFQTDWIESIFFFISRIEEYYCPENNKDRWGMMKEELQLLVKFGVEKIPVVDHLVYCILQLLKITPSPLSTKWSMSHDIDVIAKYRSIGRLTKDIIKTLIYKKSVLVASQLVQNYAKCKKGIQKDPFDTFDWLFSSSVNYSHKAVYLMAGGITKYDNHFDIHEEKVDEIIASATQNGYEIGIHPSYASPNHLDMITAEKRVLENRLGKTVDLSRQHYLRFDWKKTPAYLLKAGIIKDSSLGYQNIIGFRCGTGFPYYLYDFENEKRSELLEIPMVIMDSALIRENGGDVEKANTHLRSFLQQNKWNTQIIFNFHNSSFENGERILMDSLESISHALP